MLKKTMLLIDLFCKYAGSFRDDALQVRDPNQLTMKFIKPEDIKIKKYTSETIPPNLLNLLKEEYNNGGSIVDMYREIKGKVKGYKIYCAYVGTDLAGVIVVDEEKSANIFVASKYRQQYVGTKLYNTALKENKKLDIHSSPLAYPFYSKLRNDIEYNYDESESDYYYNNNEQEEKQQYNPDQLVLFKNFEGLFDRIKNYAYYNYIRPDESDIMTKIIKNIGGYNSLPAEIYDYILEQLIANNRNICYLITRDLTDLAPTSGIENLVEKALNSHKNNDLRYCYKIFQDRHNNNK